MKNNQLKDEKWEEGVNSRWHRKLMTSIVSTYCIQAKFRSLRQYSICVVFRTSEVRDGRRGKTRNGDGENSV